MITLLYDGSLEGYLTAIFEAYERGLDDYEICKGSDYQPAMFAESITIPTHPAKAKRVWKGLEQKLSATGLDYLYCAHLSEMPGADRHVQGFIRHVFASEQNIERNFSNPHVLSLAKTSKMVHRERHRMKAFIRFQLTKDGIYYAAVQPDFNVLPLILSHFKNRYADQRWIIYDLKRKYGLYYNLDTVENIELHFSEENGNGSDISVSFDEKEAFYQQLWKDYFKSTHIASRKNTKLHIRHVPKRYWRLLTEKSVIR